MRSARYTTIINGICPLIALTGYKVRNYSISRLSPFFIDSCFSFLSIVGSDSAVGLLDAHFVFGKCRSLCAPINTVNVIRKSVPNKNLLKISTKVHNVRKAGKLGSVTNVNASSLFRKRSTSAFLLFTLTRSLLPNTEMYSVYRRSLLIISFKSVKLHLAFDYTDYSFAENVLATDISSLKFFNSFKYE